MSIYYYHVSILRIMETEVDFKKIYNDKFTISFEIFPPKTAAGDENLFAELKELVKYKPEFISVTYGAGGSTREKTIDLAVKIKNEFAINPLVHFTCVGSDRDDIKNYLHRVKKLGLDNILALRGDPPAGNTGFVKPENGFSYADELIKYIKSIEDFRIAVAGYPEKHAEAVSFADDINNLKKKIDAGGEVILTQLFLDNTAFFRYVDAVHAAGIKVPVIPGIMPLVNERQIERMVQLSGANIPSSLKAVLENCANDDEIASAGIDFAISQCAELIKYGVSGFHFYPLNKANAVSRVLNALSFKA